MKTIQLAAVSFALLVTMAAARAEVAVVVSAKSAAGNLTAEQVAAIFLAKTSEFPGGGGQAVPIDQSEGVGLRDEFYQKVANRDAAQLKAYWSRLVFTGKGQPPKAMPNSGEVKKLVSTNPNMIGYIEKAAVDASVKVLLNLP